MTGTRLTDRRGLTALWWWIDRWRKSTAYTDMTLEEQGAYRNLLDEANLRGGPLPTDEGVLAKACGDPRRWKKVRPKVLAHFSLGSDGWRNQTLDEVLARSNEIAAKRSTSGKAGAFTRWQTHGKPDGKPDGKPIANTIAPDPDPDPDPGSVRTDSGVQELRPVFDDPDLAERAGRFIERYAALFFEHRRGAKYHSKPALDFQEALGLCATWDNVRLETLVVAFLTTDDTFCRSGPGTIAQFRSRASWCDAKLREAGL